MKGIVLAGGTGSRLDPLTRVTNKHLLPVGDKPMVQWAVDFLAEAGVTELLLVTGADHVDDDHPAVHWGEHVTDDEYRQER